MHGSAAQTSYNFTLGKIVAIFTVAAAHFLPIPGDWILASTALFVFGFSSGYFTSAKYDNWFSLSVFWRQKLVRLVPDLVVINVFLFALFIAQGESGLWTWQTLVNVVGLTGFLNWFGIDNASPFGAGLWFLTLLLIFYAVYPALRYLRHSRTATVVFAAVTLVACILLDDYVRMGHSLWWTAWSFIFGLTVQRLNPRVPVVSAGLASVGLVVAILGLNHLLDFKQLNPILIPGLMIATTLWLKEARLPRVSPLVLAPLSGCLLEIYLLHSYLFLRPSARPAIDFAVSIVCVTAVSLLLAAFADRLRVLTFSRRQEKTEAPGRLVAND